MSSQAKKSPLLVLAAAASSLPGYAQEPDAELGYRFTHYVEGDLEAARSISGQAEARYEIQTHQISVSEGPRENRWSLSGDLMIETLSGASPWFVVPNEDGDPVQVMSGATIQEQRYALYGQAWRDRQEGRRLGLAAGVSKENDYFALSGGIEGQWDSDQKRSTYTAGLGYSADQIDPTEGGSERFPDRPVSESKQTLSAYAGFSRVLNPTTVAQVSASFAADQGYLSDPYKLVSIEGQLDRDNRPDERRQLALGLRVRHYLRGMSTAVRADFRHFQDDWEIVSNTLELGTLSRFGEHLRFTTNLRWYSQSRAAFYSGYYAYRRADGYHSSDYRLSAYGAASARLGFDYLGEAVQWALGVESYRSDSKYAPARVDYASPGLVDFQVYTLAVSYLWGD